MLKKYMIKALKVLLAIVLVMTSFTSYVHAQETDPGNDTVVPGEDVIPGGDQKQDDIVPSDDDPLIPLPGDDDPLIPLPGDDHGIYEADLDGTIVTWDPSLLEDQDYDSFEFTIHISYGQDELTIYGPFQLDKDETFYDLKGILEDEGGVYEVKINPYKGDEPTGESFFCVFESYLIEVELHAHNSKGEPYYETDGLATIKGDGYLILGDTTTLTVTPIEGFEFEYFLDEDDLKYEENNLVVEGIEENVCYRAYIVGDISNKVNLDFGKGHEKLAESLYEKQMEYDEDVTLDGAVLSLKYDIPVNLAELLDRIEAFMFSGQPDAEEVPDEYDRTDVYDNGEKFLGASIESTNSYKGIIDYVEKRYSEEHDRLLEDNETIYMNWLKPVDKVEFDVEKPICGDEVTNDDFVQENHPEVHIDLSNNFHVVLFDELFGSIFPEAGDEPLTYWIDIKDPDIDAPDFKILDGRVFEGKFEGDKKYHALVIISADWGYYFTDDVKNVKVNGEDEFKIRNRDPEDKLKDIIIYTFVTLKAEHEFELGEISKNGEPGYEHSICDHEHDEIRKEFRYSLSSADKLFNKNSPKDLVFVYKRSLEDENTYHKFNVVAVDDRALESDEFEATEGSLIMTLNKEYLKTLSIGEHELIVEFTDGYMITKFTVTENSKYKPIPNTGVE